MSDDDQDDTPHNETAVPVLVIETATFYFPHNTTFTDAATELRLRLNGLDYTMVMAEVTPHQQQHVKDPCGCGDPQCVWNGGEGHV